MKKIIFTKYAPAAIGPYNQAVVVDSMIYTSGNISLNTDGQLVGEGDIKEQSQKVMENLNAVLNEAGSSLEHIVKTTCFLTDMNNFAAFNEVYGSFFDPKKAPARSTVEVSRLPKDVLVEVEAIARIPKSE